MVNNLFEGEKKTPNELVNDLLQGEQNNHIPAFTSSYFKIIFILSFWHHYITIKYWWRRLKFFLEEFNGHMSSPFALWKTGTDKYNSVKLKLLKINTIHNWDNLKIDCFKYLSICQLHEITVFNVLNQQSPRPLYLERKKFFKN